ncbi:glycosyltransferase [Vibrio fluvialis]|uniref:glycosyltransferase n=1 Tax=Vibrio fluvialis TaxID=676 RepID=UPI003BB09E9D
MSISVSVVVPVYAGEKYLASLVNEVEKVRQSWMTEDYPCYISELIFVDDDSKDGSREVRAFGVGTFDHAGQKLWSASGYRRRYLVLFR